MRTSRLQFFGGASLVVISIIALVSTWHLDSGTPGEIGAGAPPRVLAFILLGFGLLIAAAAVVFNEQGTEKLEIAFRAIIAVLGGVIVFGLTIRSLGILGASPLLLLIAGFASAETRWKEFVPFVLGLTIFCTVLFRFVLGLPIPLAPLVLGY